jgi:hypothetical protein
MNDDFVLESCNQCVLPNNLKIKRTFYDELYH